MSEQTLFGLDAEVAERLEAKRDRAWEREVAQWIARVLGRALADEGDLQKSLRDGIALCELLNTLQPGCVPRYNTTFRTPLQEVENIQLYLKGCWALNVPDVFTIADLHKGRSIGLVAANVASLARTAVALGWSGPTLGPIQTGANSVRKHAAVETAPRFRHTDDVVAGNANAVDTAVARAQLALADAQIEQQRLTAATINLAEELRGLLESHRAERTKLEARLAACKAPQNNAAAQKTTSAATASSSASDGAGQWSSAVSEQSGAVWARAEAAAAERRAAEETLRNAEGRVAALRERRAALQSALAERREGAVATVQVGPTQAVPVAASGLDPARLQLLQRLLGELLRSRPVGFLDVAELAADFRAEGGRRVFALGLRLLLHRRKAVELASDALELLLFLLNSCLAHMDVATAGDCLTGRVIISAAHKVFRRTESGGEDHVYNYVRDHELWQSPTFWEEDFWFREVKRARTQGGEGGQRRAAVACCYNARQWGCPPAALLPRLVAPDEMAACVDELRQLGVAMEGTESAASDAKAADAHIDAVSSASANAAADTASLMSSFERRMQERKQRREEMRRERDELHSSALK